MLSSAAQNFAAKLAAKFIGLCKIIIVYSSLVHEIEDVESKRVMKVHISDLKKYLPPRVLTPNPPPAFPQDEDDGAPSSPRASLPRSQPRRKRPHHDAEAHESDGAEESPPAGSSHSRAPLGTRGRKRGRPRAAGGDHASVRDAVAASPPRNEPTTSREGVPERMLGEAEEYVARSLRKSRRPHKLKRCPATKDASVGGFI